MTVGPRLGDGETEAAAGRERSWQPRGWLGEGGWFVGLEDLSSKSKELPLAALLSSLGGSVFSLPP